METRGVFRGDGHKKHIKKHFVATATLLLVLSAIPLSLHPSTGAPVGMRQEVFLHLGGDNNTQMLSTDLPGYVITLNSSSVRAAREEILFDDVAILGTWKTQPIQMPLDVGGQVRYSFFVSGDVEGAFLRLEISLGNRTYTHDTSPTDLSSVPVEMSGSFEITDMVSLGEGDVISLTLYWGGSQNILDSVQNNTLTLWYGAPWRDSWVSIKVPSVDISDVDVENTATNTTTFAVKARSAFGVQDLATWEFNVSADRGEISNTTTTVEGNLLVYRVVWDHSMLQYADVTITVSAKIWDKSGNLWEKTSQKTVIQPREKVDFSISPSDIAISPARPHLGDTVNITVYFTGLGKNWDSAPVKLEFYEGAIKKGEKNITGRPGTNGPFTFTWKPEALGDYVLTFKLDETAIAGRGAVETNNVVSVTVTVIPPLDKNVVVENTGLPIFFMAIILIVAGVLISAGIAGILIKREKSARKTIRQYTQPPQPHRESSPQIPSQQHTPYTPMPSGVHPHAHRHPSGGFKIHPPSSP